MEIDYSKPESQQLIIQRCEECRKSRINILSPDNHTNLVVKLNNHLVVKFGIGVTAAEAYALSFASRTLDPAVVKVPSLAQFFTRSSGELWTTGYLVMDLVEGTQLDQLPLPDSMGHMNRVMEAIRHMHSFSGGTCPGPLDGSHARGLLWSEYSSGQSFNSRNDLQKYLDARLAYSKDQATIDVTNIPLSLCHLDIAPRNIMVSSDGSIYLLDWGCAGFYPSVFETWAIQFEAHVGGHPFMNALGSDLINCRPSEQVEIDALTHVYAVNQSTGFPNPDAQRETDYFMRMALGDQWKPEEVADVY